MKIKAVVLAMVCLCFTAVRPAVASFFDNSGGKMDITQWIFDRDVAELVDYDYASSERLQFSASIPVTDNQKTDDGWVDIHSEWALSLSQDFNISTGFHVDHLGTGMQNAPSDYNKVEAYFGLIDMNDAQNGFLHYINLAAKNDIGDSGTAWNAFMLGVGTDPSLTTPMSVEISPVVNAWGEPPFEPTYWWERDSIDGVLMYSYDAEGDVLIAAMKDENGDVVASGTFNAFHQTTGIDELYVSLGVWANEPATFGGQDVNFYNFQVHEGPNTVVTPEPASMVLFGLGGAAMAFARRRRV